MGVVDDDTHQWLLGSYINFSQVVVVKDSFLCQETVAEMGRLICRAFQYEMEPDYITVSKLLLFPVAKGLWKH